MVMFVQSYRKASGSLVLDDEISALSPEGYWRLDETSGTTATDSSGNGRNGTYSGSYTLNHTTGADGSGLVNFTNGYVNLGDVSAFEKATAPGLTVFMIVKPTASVTTRRHLFTKAGASNYEWAFEANPTDKIGSRFWNTTGSAYSGGQSTNSVLSTSIWNCIAFRCANDNQAQTHQHYHNSGTSVATTQDTPNAKSTQFTTGDAYIGDRRDGGGTEWAGLIGRVAIFGGAVDLTNVFQAAEDEGWY